MHFLDSIFIFVLALVLFGPKRLPEIGRQIGKLLVEFRRASNDFKMQIEDELRTMEQQDRQKKLEAAAAQPAALPAPESASQSATQAALQPAIMLPLTGAPVSAESPYSPVTPPVLPAPEFASPEFATPELPGPELPSPDLPTPVAAEPSSPLSAANSLPQTTSNGHAPLSQAEAEPEQAQLHHG